MSMDEQALKQLLYSLIERWQTRRLCVPAKAPGKG